jgi:hypothetical protein
MYIRREKGPVFVTLPDGTRMSRGDLPPRDTARWVARRKAQVVRAVESGLIQQEEACDLYDISSEELDSWRRAMTRYGTNALKATAVGKYRQP